MKHFVNIFKYSLFLSLVVAMVSCGGDDDDEPETDPKQETVDALKGTVTLSDFEKPNGASDLVWEGMTVTWTASSLEGGSFTTSGSADPDVWPASGTWTFTGDAANKITRNDGVVITLALTTEQVETAFNISTSAGRTMVVDGDWSFTFDF